MNIRNIFIKKHMSSHIKADSGSCAKNFIACRHPFAKLKGSSGESLLESLVGILIVTLCMAALVTAIVTASTINRKVRDTDVAFKYSKETESTAGTITITDSANEKSEDIKVDMYEDADGHGYLYYNKTQN